MRFKKVHGENNLPSIARGDRALHSDRKDITLQNLLLLFEPQIFFGANNTSSSELL